MVLLGAVTASAASGQPAPPAFQPDPAAPIELDASYSELDRRNNRVTFRGLTISQGSLRITADEAAADPADFTDSVWVFTGNVVLRSADTTVECARAEMHFRTNRLDRATMTGQPARFRQQRADGGTTTEGRGNLLEYDVGQGIIRIGDNAWLSDGANEITGASISYDLRREIVSAGADETGKVRMKIKPRSQ
jgi:lipopolysaccharide transport protein LptA